MQLKRLLMFIPVIFMGVCTACVCASDIYKSVDENGQVVYSDTPSENSELKEYSDIMTMPLRAPNKTAYEEKQEFNETFTASVNIASPKNESHILIEQNGNFVIQTNIKVPMSQDVSLVLYRDGKEIMKGQETSFNLKNQDRGEHLYTVKLLDNTGEVLSADSITLFVQRGRIRAPTN